MIFDTHAHLNYAQFNKILNRIVLKARDAGISYIVVPGDDVVSSQKAIQIAQKYTNIFAATGIHPHRVYQLSKKHSSKKKIIQILDKELLKIENMLSYNKVVAVGEVGLDTYYTKDYTCSKFIQNKNLIDVQTYLLNKQILFAKKYNKALILHNRGFAYTLLEVLQKEWDMSLMHKIVFHCCEAEDMLLSFALKHKIYIGIDGDITWSKKKQEFIKKVPITQLVLETDSPYMIPLELKHKVKYNTPENINAIAQKVAQVYYKSIQEVIHITTQNACQLFRITPLA